MISNKTAVILFFIALCMRITASTSSYAQELNSSYKHAPQIRKQRHTPRVKENALLDTISKVENVEVIKESVEKASISKEQLAGQKRDGPGFLEIMMNRGKYNRVCYFAGRIEKDKFLERICSVVKTLEQCKGFAKYLKNHKLMTFFYVHGDMRIVKEAIVKSKVYNDDHRYVRDGDLETALPLALKEDNHDRFIELLKVRQEITAQKDRRLIPLGRKSSFESFVTSFLSSLAPWEDGMTLKRFLTFSGDRFGDKYRDVFDILCQELVSRLKFRLDNPNAEKFLVDMLGQPSLLTSVTFAKGFLFYANDTDRSAFIKYGWDESIKEGLKKECGCGGEKLWQMMKKVYPNLFSGDYPNTKVALDNVLNHFPTKQELEEEWNQKHESNFLKKLEYFFVDNNLLLIVLARVVFEYADPKPTLLDV